MFNNFYFNGRKGVFIYEFIICRIAYFYASLLGCEYVRVLWNRINHVCFNNGFLGVGNLSSACKRKRKKYSYENSVNGDFLRKSRIPLQIRVKRERLVGGDTHTRANCRLSISDYLVGCQIVTFFRKEAEKFILS